MHTTSEKFIGEILPVILASWGAHCFCVSPGFRKLLSFNFEDYGTSVMQLVDAELVGYHVVKANFDPVGGMWKRNGDTIQLYRCKRCSARCEQIYADYSLVAYRSYYRFLDEAKPAAVGVYLIGMQGFSIEDYKKVHDFREAASVSEFLGFLGVT